MLDETIPMTWFGDFNSLCFSSCVPLPSCNLLSETLLDATRTSPSSSTISATARAAGDEARTGKGVATSAMTALLQAHQEGRSSLSIPWSEICMFHGWHGRDVGMIVASLVGLLLIFQVLRKSRRMFSAVGRMEMTLLFLVYCIILLLQIFTIGGVVSRNNSNRTLIIWVSALHLGAVVSFFWVLIINALILYQFVEDGTKYTVRFIVGTSIAWMVGVTFLALDLAMDLTSHHHGHSPVLFFLTLIFPAVATVLYLILVCVVVLWRLEECKALIYAVMALAAFTLSQIVLFVAGHQIAVATSGHVNGSMFATLLDLVAVVLLYQFWHNVTDDSWGDVDF